MSSATPLFSPTLESVQLAFDDWRATRGKRTRTPVNLKRRAVALRDTHPASHICSALKINDTALKRWADELLPTPPLRPGAAASLVELPTQATLSGAADLSDNVANTISINVGDVIQLQVHGPFTLEQILCAVSQHQPGARA